MSASDVQMVASVLRKARQAYNASKVDENRQEHLQQAVNLYEEALQIFNDDLSIAERVESQKKVDEARADMLNAYNELLDVHQDTGPLPANPPVNGGSSAFPPPSRRFFPSHRLLFVLLVALVLLVTLATLGLSYLHLTASASNFVCVAGQLKIDGSTALQPLVSAARDDYVARCPEAHITVATPGAASITGLNGVEGGTLQIGDSDIFAFPAQHDLVDHQVAVVTFALIVNIDVAGIHNLDVNAIKGIYTGVYTNWDQLGGPDLKIVPLSRTINSGTRYTFQKYILQGVETVSGVGRTTAPDVVQEVEQTPGSISYTNLDKALMAPHHDVTILSIDGVAPGSAQVKDNTYRFWNIEHMYTRGQPDALAQAFLNYVYSDASTVIQKRQQHQLPGYLDITQVTQIMRDSRHPEG